jgi:CDP-6-deoxy-D-xylo-4-hexulose-3-dehydrase
MKMKRSHGMAREAMVEKYEEYRQENPQIHPMFMFMTDGYNFRSMELNAVLGLSQLPHLDKNNDIRRLNFDRFIKILIKYGLYHNLKIDGNSSFCLPFICNNETQKQELEKFLNEVGVETRPLCSGNLLIQPFLKNYNSWDKKDSIVNMLHTHGFFIGNNHLITKEEFDNLDELMNQFFNKTK